MNTTFSSNTNEAEALSLNTNNIIIVSGDSAEWSREFSTVSRPLRVVSNIMGTLIPSDSNETGNEAGNLNTKNVMIVSEDSSEWNQDFIGVNENEAHLNAANDGSGTIFREENTTDQSNEESTQNLDVQSTSRIGKIEPGSESNPLVDINEPSSEEQMEMDVLRCRTCLNIIEVEEDIPLFTPQTTGETLKDLLIYLLPQMATTVCDEDVVCPQCDNNIRFCVEFIDNCLRVETELVGEVDDQCDQDTTDASVLRKDEKTHVSLDHDYMVGQPIVQIKTEDESLMETQESELTDSYYMNDDNNDGYLYECLKCGLTFESENSLDEHARTQHGVLKEVNKTQRIYYKCNPCEELFPTELAYNNHVRISHPEAKVQPMRRNTYTCKQCGNKFLNLGELFEHKRNAHGFMCNICPERFTTKKDLDDHLESHPNLYFCELCNQGFKTRKALSSHVMEHDDPGINLCEECGRNFSSPEELALHMEQSDHPVKITIRKFMCEICDAAFTDRKKLNKHRRVYHECVREYLCTICDKNFSSKTSLDSHYRLKHAELKPYQCERCGERFARLDYLRRHNNCSDQEQCKKFLKGPRRKFRYTKADGEPIRCKLCGKVFKDVYLLKLHLTTHTNLRRFRCSVCNLTFTTNKNRERHEKIHDDPLSKYRCTVCWKRTQSQQELDEHLMTHEKKYQCHVCQESFARVYLLNFHVSELHADDEDVEKEKQIVFTEGLKEYLVDY